MGIISILHHVRLRGKKGEIVGAYQEEKWAKGGTLENAAGIGERRGQVSVSAPVSCTDRLSMAR